MIPARANGWRMDGLFFPQRLLPCDHRNRDCNAIREGFVQRFPNLDFYEKKKGPCAAL